MIGTTSVGSGEFFGLKSRRPGVGPCFSALERALVGRGSADYHVKRDTGKRVGGVTPELRARNPNAGMSCPDRNHFLNKIALGDRMPVFSVTPTLAPQERIPQHVELQLLPDDELMDLWEQTQQAAWAMEGRGWDAEGALRYSGVLVWEMQRRLAGRPPAQRFGVRAGLAAGSPD